MTDQTPRTEAVRRRALIALFRNHPDTQRNERYGWSTPALAAERRETLLQWSSTLSDHQLLRMRNIGAKSLAWVRDAASEHHVHRYECGCGRAAQPAPLLDEDRLRVRIGAVVDRWYHLGLIRFNSRDDGGDDLILRDELVRAALAALEDSDE